MKVGDTIKFKKFKWVIVKVRISPAGVLYAMYRVYRKYYGVYVTNTHCNYSIFPSRWNFLKSKLKQNPDYHYTMSLWSNAKRS